MSFSPYYAISSENKILHHNKNKSWIILSVGVLSICYFYSINFPYPKKVVSPYPYIGSLNLDEILQLQYEYQGQTDIIAVKLRTHLTEFAFLAYIHYPGV